MKGSINHSDAFFWQHEAMRLAEALQSLIVQIDKANFQDELGHPLRMNVAYFSAKDALAARGRQGKEQT